MRGPAPLSGHGETQRRLHVQLLARTLVRVTNSTRTDVGDKGTRDRQLSESLKAAPDDAGPSSLATFRFGKLPPARQYSDVDGGLPSLSI